MRYQNPIPLTQPFFSIHSVLVKTAPAHAMVSLVIKCTNYERKVSVPEVKIVS